MKKCGWFGSLLIAAVFLAYFAFPPMALSSVPAVKVIELTGAATVSIPIQVPPGRAGLQPKLSLTYKSYQKNGWIGMGWGLGMGAIVRSTKRGIDYEGVDFIANGQELVPVDIDGLGNGTYQAKIESGFAIYNYSQSTGWVMTTKNGTKYYFGQTTISRQDDPANGSRVFKWCLDKVVDPNGNYMTVQYLKDQGEIYLDLIGYTGNGSIEPTHSVKFHLVSRPDTSSGYALDFKTTTSLILNSIEVLYQDQLVRRYVISYDPSASTLRSLATSITQYGSDGVTSKVPITPVYQDPQDGFAANVDQFSKVDAALESSISGDKVFAQGDFDGDGDTDLFVSESVQSGYMIRAHEAAKTYLSNGDGSFSKINAPLEGGWNGMRVFAQGDFDSDGDIDFLVSDSQNLEYMLNPQITTKSYLSNGDGTFTKVDSPLEGGISGMRVFAQGDFDGDGDLDFLVSDSQASGYMISPQSTTKSYLSNGDGTFTKVDAPLEGGWVGMRVFAMGDFDGDRLTDILISDSLDIGYMVNPQTTTKTYLSNGDGTFRKIDAPMAGAWNGMRVFAQGDYNGDGLTDFLAGDSSNYGYMVNPQSLTKTYLAIGDGTFEKVDAPLIGGWTGMRVFAQGDFNGDGITDFLAGDSSNEGYMVNPQSITKTYLSKGNGTFAKIDTPLDGSGTGMRVFAQGDFDGNGKADFLISDSQHWYMINPATSSLSFLSESLYPDLLSSIPTGMGGNISVDYTSSTSYENKLLPFILHTGTKIITTDGNGNSSETSYAYSGGLFDPEKREFRGFKEVIRTHDDGSTLKKIFYQGDDEPSDPDDTGDQFAFKGRLNYEEVRETSDQSTNANLIGRTEFTWAVRSETASNGYERSFVYLDEKATNSFENGQEYLTVHTDNIDFDAWGQLLERRTWDAQGSAEALTNTFAYFNYGSDSDPLWRKSMDQVSGDTSGPVRQVWYRYTNDGKANLEEKEHWNNLGDNPIFRIEYYDNGNVWKEWDPKNQLIAEYTYDQTSETFQESVTNALGHTLTKTYDPRFGIVTSETDANGNTTVHHPDEFGRIVRVDLPNGGESVIEYHDDVFPTWVKKRVLESDNPVSYINSYEYFDGLGRTIQTVSIGEGGDKSVVTRTSYDTMGREKETFGPFFVAGVAEGVLHDVPATDVPKSWADYDLRGRPYATHALDGDHGTITSLIGYDGLSTTTTDPDTAQKTTTKDYLGRVRQVVEHTETGALTITYTYNAAGDLTQVTDVANNITTINYDSLGRKINMTDPDMGHWEYEYDANGNLEWQKDANLHEIQIQYDVLDRITAKNYLTPTPQDRNVTYSYDDPDLTAANYMGQLSRVTNGVVTTTYNDYDELGQVLSVTKSISGDTPRTTQYTYDLSGKALSTVYPDNYQVNHTYYPGTGLIQSVMGLNDLVNYVTFEDYPATGNIKKAVYGNGTETVYTRDSFSTRLSAILTKDAAGAAIIDKSYMYSKAGDIEDINDAVKGVSYSYDYDKLHRLKNEINSAGGDDLAYTYNDMGGFLTKSNGSVVMTYNSYDPDHVHAVNSITVAAATYTFSYDANGNMTNGYDFTDPLNPVARTIDYNSENMPVQIVHATNGTTSFTYDGSGSRARKTGPNGSTFYYGALFEKQGSVEVKYIFAGGQRVAQVKGTDVKYFHKDHLVSSTVVTDANGNKTEETEYMPFGAQRGGGPGITLTNYGFTDQEKDPETGLYNYNARHYDPAIGVFISADTLVPDLGGSQAYNRYAYCINNPLIYVDPTGHIFGAIADWWGDTINEFFSDLKDDYQEWSRDTGENIQDFLDDHNVNVNAECTHNFEFGSMGRQHEDSKSWGTLSIDSSLWNPYVHAYAINLFAVDYFHTLEAIQVMKQEQLELRIQEWKDLHNNSENTGVLLVADYTALAQAHYRIGNRKRRKGLTLPERWRKLFGGRTGLQLSKNATKRVDIFMQRTGRFQVQQIGNAALLSPTDLIPGRPLRSNIPLVQQGHGPVLRWVKEARDLYRRYTMIYPKKR